VTGRIGKAQLTDLADMLAEVDQFLRSAAGHAALEEYYAARGSTGPGFDAGNLVDWVSFTALWLRGKAAPQAPRS
jgi:hypothetical protein